jgi:glutathione peroxidase
MSIYEFNIKTIDGDSISLKKYEGKVLLIVNTASK